MKKFFQLLMLVCCFVVILVAQALAAIDTTTLTSITDGLGTATADFYKIGGAMLVVGAGIWAFRKVKALIGV